MNIEQYIDIHGRMPDSLLNFARETFRKLKVPFPGGTTARIGSSRRTYWWQRRKPRLWALPWRRRVMFDRGQLLDAEDGIKLWQPWWMAMVCHELAHIAQRDRYGWRWPFVAAGNFAMTIGSFGYKHGIIPIELELNQFNSDAVSYWTREKSRLQIFKDMDY